MTFSEIHRLYFIIKIFLTYGLYELIPPMRLTFPIRLWRFTVLWIPHCHQHKDIGVRMRLAIEQLGPVWIKFGQMLSTRRDLFPRVIADQLAILQDGVAPFDGVKAKKQIEKSIGGPIETWFNDFDIKPLASASIAQVHTASLKSNNKKVVIKVIRPDILPVIRIDMKLMYRLACWVPRFLREGRRLHSMEVVRDYEKTLIDELNLLREAANAIQLRRNFADSNILYVPEVYSEYCSETMLVMERIYGIPISDMATLSHHGVNMKLLAERGVQIFFTQVFRDSFFHADMHPGNIFVSYDHPEDPKYISIDYGIVGSLNKKDKRYLAENFIAFFNRNYRKVAELHVDSGWVPPDTSVEDFEFAIRTVCEPIFEKPLADISFGHVLLDLFSTARRFNMEVQPQLVLLQKTLLCIEGISRQLYPQLDLWKTAKPFLENWIKDQIGLTAMLHSLKEQAYFWAEKFPELPELFYDIMHQHELLHHSVDKLVGDIHAQRTRHYKASYLFGVGAILLLSGTALLLSRQDCYFLPFIWIVTGILIWLIGWHKTN
ncbi:ubiquinone biosynthesis regulatory protein kinase UbiB [Pantoea sp. Nvir]|uniref:ubiquinone biosynthesis regulatory protein kinase UbiB n=1 Tax=Pantoea sp. Nvir TaxID=2576760 RepID=UPI0027F638AB|nr:ubiquinone biosynthesis regulatory protein kinase UbiB [Pantoea sp. Nvir]CAJ0992555.1 putative protein kinase UbiB [Pantoea sp. Nvir]